MSQKSSAPVPDVNPSNSSAPQYTTYQQSGVGAVPANAPPQYQQPQPIPGAQPTYAYSSGPGAPVAATMGQPAYGSVAATPVVLVQPAYGSMNLFPHFPVQTTCPFCSTQMVTSIKKEPGLLAWLSCGILALMGCVFGCCLIPFCLDPCQDTEHYCSNCHRLITVKRQMDC